jgi:cyclic pyranopterin phosphate synthase
LSGRRIDRIDYNGRMPAKKLTHIDESGRAHMVDVTEKADTDRLAIARGEVILQLETIRLIREGLLKKGDVLMVAQVAGI